MDFHTEVPLISLLGLVHLRIAFTLLILGGALSCNQSCIYNRSTMYDEALLIQRFDEAAARCKEHGKRGVRIKRTPRISSEVKKEFSL